MSIGITLMNGKGGAGKSTIAIILADILAEAGQRVAIVDTDARQNMVAWWADCKKNEMQRPGLSIVSTTNAATIEASSDQLFERFDCVIFDTAGQDTTIPAVCLARSDILVSPVQVAKREIVGVHDANMLLKSLIKQNLLPPTTPHYIVPTRTTLTSQHTDIYKTLNLFIGQLGAKRAGCDIADRNFYKELQNGMSTIVGYTPEKQSQIDSHRKMLIEAATITFEVAKLVQKPEGQAISAAIEQMMSAKNIKITSAY